MSLYHGPTLPVGAIRLLRLLPCLDKASRIECTLSPYCLLDSASTHPFEALSYVWGSQKSPEPILVNGFECEIGENLHAALLRLRDGFVERVIWVDAICINQQDNTEKSYQVQSMAKIYAKASRVLVWLGTATETSELALHHIRRAGGQRVATKASTQTTEQDTKATEKAVFDLLKRPWFERIWVLQEAAAARHVLIMCGPTVIDGYAFCAGLNALQLSYQKYPELEGLIPPILYLVQDAVFRPQYEEIEKFNPQERFSLKIRPLCELVDMYHSHKATVCLDKVYALLGMSDDSPHLAGLEANYDAAWERVLDTLARFCLSKNISISVSTENGAEAVMVIEARGCILGEVSSAGEDMNQDQGQSDRPPQYDNQQVRITWKDTPSHFEEKTSFTFHAAAKAVRKGDFICLLRGARTPTVIRLRDHVSTIIRIAIPPTDDLNKRVASITAFPDNLLLIWDWNTSQPKWHSGEEYWSFIRSRGVPTCSMAVCRCLHQLDKAARLWDVGRWLSRMEKWEEAAKTFQSALESYKAGMAERSLDKTCLGHGLCRDMDEKTLGIMGTPVIDDNSAKAQESEERIKEIQSWATKNGLEVVVRLLVDKDASIEVTGSLGQALWWWAVENGHGAVIWLLADKGANIETAKRDQISGQKWTPIWLAAKNGHEAVVRILIDKGANIEVKDDDRTPLLCAAENGYKAVVRLLLEKGANVEAADYDMQTPISRAARNGHEAIVRLLIDKGANTEALDIYQQTPLFWAARDGNEAVIRLLVDKGADIDAVDRRQRTPLAWAAANGHATAVRLLVDKGADIEALGRCVDTPLWLAARSGHEATVRLLIDEGADIETVDRFQRTPLLWAAKMGFEAVVRLLVDKGANIEAVDVDKRTPLVWAAANGHVTAIRLLVDKGANIEAVDYGKQTPLVCAAEKGHITAVRVLIDKGANIEASGYLEPTPLRLAARNGYEVIVRLLVDEGADIEAIDDFQRTPLLWAARNGHEAVVRLLVDKGANIEAVNRYKQTPLSMAASEGHQAVVRLLVDKGANIEALDRYRRTPLSLAARGGHEAVVQLLKSHSTRLL